MDHVPGMVVGVEAGKVSRQPLFPEDALTVQRERAEKQSITAEPRKCWDRVGTAPEGQKERALWRL